MITISERGTAKAMKTIEGARLGRRMVRVVRDVTSHLARYLAEINPVDTGAMRDSWTWVTVGLIGQVYISESSHNPRSGVPVTDYASIVDARVGLLDAAMVEGRRVGAAALGVRIWKR